MNKEEIKNRSIAQAKKIREESRTSVDFSKHELNVVKEDHVLIHDLKIPHSVHNRVKFINTSGVLAVTGDYGNWIFCREFHPSKDGYSCDSYWGEKLQIAGNQKSTEFCPDLTEEYIKEEINGGLSETGYEGKELSQMIEYYKSCLNYLEEGEFWYQSFAYSNYPSFADYECIPECKKTPYWLEVVYDAFNEICDRLQNEGK